ncbi:DNA-binding response regulator [Allofranklinella schreckenbergeri]|uniref:DNA-binding response regulator n=1 Tax=Allofranklinella schreckenbergeri TaxID=1076744 RepID=A0A3M6R7X7_9BURK|nr:LytTR family DNA-binding domain-containing protein [Allofranklinella schreckenbergeri]RMX11345.1 DNA-binding response regulator [Allofranklinella schreckenbergeri]RRD44195.1 response regulator [Comamonadaceae bacterium OH3737_COT-264]
MNVLIVDDEALARKRLRTLLEALPDFPCRVMEAAAVSQAQEILARTQDNAAIDVILLDIQMPGMDGVQFAQTLRTQPRPPAIVFVTAHAEYAVRAFELEAADYLTKPVRSERLHQALKRACLWLGGQAALAHTDGAAPFVTPVAPPATALANVAVPEADAPFLVVHSHQRTERVLVERILFCRAEMKYITLVTAQGSVLWDGSLNDLEKRFPAQFLRVHRNALVARKALRGLVKAHHPQEGEHWRLQLHGTQETLHVSRRMLPAVRAALQGR